MQDQWLYKIHVYNECLTLLTDICVSVSMYVHTCMHVHIAIYVCVFVCVCACTCVVCVYVCMCVLMCVCVCYELFFHLTINNIHNCDRVLYLHGMYLITAIIMYIHRVLSSSVKL